MQFEVIIGKQDASFTVKDIKTFETKPPEKIILTMLGSDKVFVYTCKEEVRKK